MSRKKALDVERRTLLIRHWKADTSIKEIAYILKMTDDTIRREIRALRNRGLITDRAVVKKKKPLVSRPENDSTNPRHKRAMRICLRCGDPFNSTHCGNRLCKGCINFASHGGGRALL